MFSERTGWDLGSNALARRLEELRASGEEVFDLTESNPTRVGLRYPEGLLAPLADPSGLLYEPQPKGLPEARQAVASLYGGKGASIDPERIVLTASTSEAYSHLFRLLADPGDEVLVPRPSYPLFGYLADLCDVKTVPYSLRLRGERWHVDPEELAAAAGPRARALVVVHPNNPTGSGVTVGELAGIAEVCRKKRLALISDEVFAEYLWDEASSLPRTLLSGGPPAAGEGPLTFALGGLSKFLGLPQMKLGWIACSGPADLLGPALERLELIADTYLSVNTPVQRALPGWLKLAPAVQAEIRGRVRTNREWLANELAGKEGARLLPSDGGWSAVLRLPGGYPGSVVHNGEEWALSLLERRRVRVHPGYLFDFDGPGHAVVSLLPPPEPFREAIRRIPAGTGAGTVVK